MHVKSQGNHLEILGAPRTVWFKLDIVAASVYRHCMLQAAGNCVPQQQVETACQNLRCTKATG